MENNYFKDIVCNSHDAIVVVGKDGKVKFANPSSEKLFGYSWSEFKGKDMGFPLADKAESKINILKKNNDIAIAELKVAETMWEGEVSYAAIIRDISKREKLFKKLKTSEKEKTLVLNSTKQSIVYQDKDQNVSWANRAYRDSAGMTLEELKGNKCIRRREFGIGCTGCPVEKTIATNKPAEAELTPKNQKHWPPDYGSWLIQASPIRNDAGEVIGAVEIATDITEKLKAQEKLKESEEKYRTLVENSTVGVYKTSREGKFLFCNEALANIFGFETPEAAMEEGTVSRYNDPDDRKEIMALFNKNGRVKSYDTELIKKDGTVINVIIIGELNGEEISGMIVDVTEQVKAKKENEELQKKVNRAQKLGAIGRLAGGIAHDFNNILTGILGTAQLLIEDEDDEYKLEDFKDIEHEAKRARDLVNQLLLFSRKKSGNPERISLNEKIKSLLKMLRRIIGEEIKVETDLAENLKAIKADKVNMDQVITNISVNARDAMSSGGILKISTENVVVSEDKKSMPTGEYVLLSIEDNGKGMDEETKDKLFEPFFTTKGPDKGTGLGLSVVYGIIEKHGGFIEVESKLGEGSRFDIYLPAVDSALEKKEKKEDELKITADSNRKIFVIEDDKSVISLLTKIFDKKKYDYVIANNKKEARKIFKSKKGEFDIIISDVVLPDGYSIDLIKEFKEKKPDIDIIATSGYLQEKSKHEIIKENNFHFLQKPFEVKDILKLIDTLTNS